MYYFGGSKVSEIAKTLGISESMAKFLLFKTRKILKEGMHMARTTGALSFHPGALQLCFWGSGGNPFWDLCANNLIAQNILLACYNDRCTADEISLQMGVAVPYLEQDLKALCEKDVLVYKGGRYETAVILFTKAFSTEADEKTLGIQREIAEIIATFMHNHLADIKAIGFHQSRTDDNLLRWHVAALILEKAVLEKYQGSLDIKYPTKYADCEAFVWGEEVYQSRYGGFGTCGLKNANGDLIRFLDFPAYGDMEHHYFYNYPGRVNIAIDIAKGNTSGFSENDMAEVAELIKRGFVSKADDELSLNLSVYTSTQFDMLLALADEVVNTVAEKTRKIMKITTDILVQHTPAAMRKDAERMGWLKMFDNAVAAPIACMLENGLLHLTAHNDHPTAYVVLR